MPTEAYTQKDLLAHCNNSLCKGYVQRPIAGIVVESSWTFKELSGNSPMALPGVERSSQTYRYENDADRDCPYCGEPRELTDEPRPQYQPVSGYSADDSLKFIGTFKPGKERTAAVEAALARLEEAISE